MTKAEAEPDLNLMCALVVRAPFERVILPAFEAGGRRVAVVWAPTAVIQQRLAAGERPDGVLVTAEAAKALLAARAADVSSRVSVVTSRLGVAVLRGAPVPDLSTVAAFRQALLAARSVAFSLTGASGIYFAGLMERLDIAEAVRARATIIPAGFTAERLVSGEADLAIQQVSELLTVDGIEIAGLFPDAVQSAMRFAAVVLSGAPHAEAAHAFFRTLSGPAAIAAFRAFGLEPG